MNHCLSDKTLWLLNEGDSTQEQWRHLEGCRVCADRYDRMTHDLEMITGTLRQIPPPVRAASIRMLLVYRSIPLAVAFLLAIALLWGENMVWRQSLPDPSDQAFNNELSQFLEQVSDAIFTGTSAREAVATAPESDLNSLQAALGETCADECQELFSRSADEATVSQGMPRGPEQQRVNYRAK